MMMLASLLFALVAAGPRQRDLESRWSKVLGESDRLPGVHFKQTDELHKERDAANLKVSLLEEKGGPRERALESKWGKVLGGGADQMPGVHFKQTDVLHKQREVASMKVSLLEKKNGPRERALENKWGKVLGGGADQMPGVHFKQTDILHKQREAAHSKVSLLRKNRKNGFGKKKNGPRERALEKKWGKIIGGGADQMPGVHFKQTDVLHKQREAAHMKINARQPSATQVALLAAKRRGGGGPRERALESKWGKVLGGGADQMPGVHFKQTDVLHKQRELAQNKMH